MYPGALSKVAWEGDLNMTITDEPYLDHAQVMVHSSSICARHGLIQCKILHKVHYTNAKLSKIYPNVRDACNRCNQSPANHTHMFWSCPKLTTFWMNFFDTMSRAYGHSIPPNPLSAIFGISPDAALPVALRRALAFTSLLPRRLILLNWKLPGDIPVSLCCSLFFAHCMMSPVVKIKKILPNKRKLE